MALLPQSVARWNNLQHIQQQDRDEYSAECPKCGDSGHIGNDPPDRFKIFISGKPRGWCRGCGYFEFADSIDKKDPPSRFEIAEMNKERAILANTERQRVAKKIDALIEAAEWRVYHDIMKDAEREMWREAGIPDSLQDWWELGYNPSLTYSFGGELKQSPALTIPYFKGEDVVNIQSRLLEPANPSDKYRFTKGLPAPLFFPDKVDTLTGTCLVTEGAKKGMIAYKELAGSRYGIDTVVSLPSKMLNRGHVEEFKDCDIIIMCLDPDAEEQSIKNAMALGKDRTLIATLPVKIDDFFVEYGATAKDVASFLGDARSVQSIVA